MFGAIDKLYLPAVVASAATAIQLRSTGEAQALVEQVVKAYTLAPQRLMLASKSA